MNVKAEKLQVKYGNHSALKDVSFELNGNKIYGLLGRNGAGKTSLLSILASFREPTSGTITINGETPFENPNIMQQVAFLYNKDYKDESDNVIDMLKDVQRYRPNFDMDYATQLVERFNLDKKKPIKQFSKGMQSSLNVVIGLASRAPLTILDEVYLGMDAPSREIFYKELLAEQEKHPRMIILSTHLVSEMDYLFDEVILINEGSILLQEEVDSLLSKGATITGDVELVNEFVRSMKQINVRQLGNTKSVTIYGELSERERETAFDKGLEIAPVSLHDLFVHLTQGGIEG
ncbi:ATP-binding cassette domain-containing protein [Bacillus nitroreducens]